MRSDTAGTPIYLLEYGRQRRRVWRERRTITKVDREPIAVPGLEVLRGHNQARTQEHRLRTVSSYPRLAYKPEQSSAASRPLIQVDERKPKISAMPGVHRNRFRVTGTGTPKQLARQRAEQRWRCMTLVQRRQKPRPMRGHKQPTRAPRPPAQQPPRPDAKSLRTIHENEVTRPQPARANFILNQLPVNNPDKTRLPTLDPQPNRQFLQQSRLAVTMRTYNRRPVLQQPKPVQQRRPVGIAKSIGK